MRTGLDPIIDPGPVKAVAAAALERGLPTDDDIDRSITNLCRCGIYERGRKAILAAARLG